MSTRVPMPPKHTQAFTKVAHGARMNWQILFGCGAPRPGSYFDQVAQIYPFESVAERVRSHLTAAFEHLILWADYAAPSSSTRTTS